MSVQVLQKRVFSVSEVRHSSPLEPTSPHFKVFNHRLHRKLKFDMEASFILTSLTQLTSHMIVSQKCRCQLYGYFGYHRHFKSDFYGVKSKIGIANQLAISLSSNQLATSQSPRNIVASYNSVLLSYIIHLKSDFENVFKVSW